MELAPPGSAQSVTQPTPLAVYTEAATTRNASGASAVLTFPAGITRAFVGVNLTVFAGGTNLKVDLQQADANGIYQTIGTTGLLTAVGPVNFSVGEGQGTAPSAVLTGPLFKLVWTVTGVFTTLTYQIGVTVR
jgi:hypothetical protein